MNTSALLLLIPSYNTPYEKIGNNEPVSIADEIPFEIPDSWEWVRLGTVLNVVSARRVHQSDWQAKGVPFYRAREIGKLSEYGHVQNELFISEELYAEFSKSGVPHPGDIMVTAVGTLGKTYIVREHDRFYYKDASVICFENYGHLCPAYIKLLMDSPFMEAQIRGNVSGTTVGTITMVRAVEYLMPIPPIEEQYRIVEKLHELEPYMEQYATAYSENEALNTAFPAELKKSILQMAVQGKLVPQDPADEPANMLLERIRAEKQRLIAEGKIKRDKHESFIFRRDNSHYEKLDGIECCIDDEIPFDIPDTWSWSRLGNLVEVITSGSRDWAKYYSETGSLFLRMGNLSRNSFELRLNNLQRVKLPENAEGTRTSLQAGDLLFSITGEVGMLGLIPDSFETAYINQHTAMIRFLPLIRNKYLPYFLLTDYAQKCYKSNQHGIKNSFRLDSISDILIPVPPFSEQERIVDQIEKIINRIATM